MQVYLCEVRVFCPDSEDKFKTVYHLIAGKTFSEVAFSIEEMYDADLDWMRVQCLEDGIELNVEEHENGEKKCYLPIEF